MSKSKSGPTLVPPPLGKLVRLAWGPGRVLTLMVLLVAMLVIAWYFVWQEVRPYVLPKYAIRPESVEITPLPDWIKTDVRAEVFRDGSLDGPLSILDEGLAERVYNAFSLHPWVAKVVQVSKVDPSLVRVELVYRRPVCMVEVTGGLYAVDVEGVVLPSTDFYSVEAIRYPRLAGIDTEPMGPVGTRWGDPRVLGGAEIAAALGSEWSAWRLQRIMPSAATSAPSIYDYTYTLFTQGGTRILWGRAPGAQVPGEIPAPEKVARLRAYVRQFGSLDYREGPRELDVRTLRLSVQP